MKNDDYRNMILSKIKYTRGFKPPFAGGLVKAPTGKLKKKDTKQLTFNLLYNRVAKLTETNKKTSKQKFEEYSNKKSIKDITAEMMDALERDIDSTVKQYLETSPKNTQKISSP